MPATSAPGLALDLERLDAAVEAAVAAGEAGDLAVLGYGEITLVLGWPTAAPALAVKRLPVFPSAGALARYEALLGDYLAVLRARGVGAVRTDLRAVPAPEGRRRGYLVQPLVPPGRLLGDVLRSDPDPDRGAALLGALAAAVTAAVDDEVGLDAQPSNWAVGGDGSTLGYLDVSTPMLRDAGGRDRLDAEVFLSIYPWALRPALRRVARTVLSGYHDPRTVLLDAASNLHKDGLDRWIPELLAAANARLDAPPIAEAEVLRYFAQDKRLWMLMQRLRRADRAWQRRVRRRAYPCLLPPPYAYGPTQLPEEASR
jgi:hypothetical protein